MSSPGQSDATIHPFHFIANLPPVDKPTIRLLHEATLQDLLRVKNDAVFRLLFERNKLLRERIELGAPPIEYSEVDFLTPLEEPLPYILSPSGLLCQFRFMRPTWARYPPDRRQFSIGIQTECYDADATVAEIELADIIVKEESEDDNVDSTKKRKRTAT